MNVFYRSFFNYLKYVVKMNALPFAVQLDVVLVRMAGVSAG